MITREATCHCGQLRLTEADQREHAFHFCPKCGPQVFYMAIEHLRQAIERWDGFKEMAAQDSDFDPIRDQPRFRDLVGA